MNTTIKNLTATEQANTLLAIADLLNPEFRAEVKAHRTNPWMVVRYGRDKFKVFFGTGYADIQTLYFARPNRVFASYVEAFQNPRAARAKFRIDRVARRIAEMVADSLDI